MREEFALKRLTDTDLTLFRWHFQNQQTWREPGTGDARQKAINLNVDVLETLFPAFQGLVPPQGVPVTLRLYGPASATAEELTRKIIRQQKNWRLDGELISNPIDEAHRFNTLRAGDLALMRFRGDTFPTEIDLVLIARAEDGDAALVDALAPLVQEGARTMVSISRDEIAEALDDAGLPDHSARALLPLDDAETVATVGEPVPPATERQADRGVYRGQMSQDDLDQTRDQQKLTGHFGEELMDAFLQGLVEEDRLSTAEWVSDANAISPYDFLTTSETEEEVRIEVKSTSGSFEDPFYVSVNELRAMTEDVPYHIYRLYKIDREQASASARIATAVSPLAEQLLDALRALPVGVAVSSLALRPSLLEWGEEFTIELTEEADL